jgi:A/G-specific adenine glycosylase
VPDALLKSSAPLSAGALPHDLAAIRFAILAWYAAAHRDFPWRRTRDPYAVLVSEVMLQQTQASRVAEAFPGFLARFPTVAALANAPDSAVLAEWSGLGYNRRAMALKRAAGAVATHGWPKTISGLQGLPGIGPYTARALASLAFGQRVGVVDTNVRRWLVRRFGLEGSAARARELQALADALAATKAVGDDYGPDLAAAWTHATMELGAAVCSARRPRCAECPIAGGCPSRKRPGHVSVRRQSAFRGSRRSYRGAVLRALATAADHRLSRARLLRELDGVSRIGPKLEAGMLESVIAELEGEGLLHLAGSHLNLGSAGSRRPATTIDP